MLKRLYCNIREALNRPIKNKYLQTALPFFLFMGIGLVVIRECATVRYEFRKVQTLDKEDMKRLGFKVREPVPLEEMYEEYKKIDIDNWENVRGPRLFEETPSQFKMELVCAFQNYHWGKKGKTSLVGKYAAANSGVMPDENKPYAEFWMGTHPNGPSLVKMTKMELSNYLAEHSHELGLKVTREFGDGLPFLFKILSVEEPLSIQAHPTKSHAEKLSQRFPQVYKDGNHKPELAIAATKFEALCSFRPLSEIRHFLKTVPEFKMVINSDKVDRFCNYDEKDVEESRNLMKDCFLSLMMCKEEVAAIALEKLIARNDTLTPLEREEYLVPLVKRIYNLFPKDVGVFCVYWLNYVELSPGEALFLSPNEPHAYLHGDCFECMANSDNVVRAGLTPKFRDIETLCQMLSYKSYHPSEVLLHPLVEDEFCQAYSPPVKDFAVAKVTLPKAQKYLLKKRHSASILLVVDGQGKLNSTKLEFGKVLFIPALSDCCIESDEGLTLLQAYCNV